MKKQICIIICLAMLFSCACAPAAGGTAVPGAPEQSPKEASPPENNNSSIHWDYSFDVIVVGYGASGAVSAIEAADNGASVLITEKAPKGEEGGCSRYCEQLITCTDDPEAFFQYLKALRGDFSYPSDAALRMYAEGGATNVEYLKYLGATDDNIEYASRGADLTGIIGAESVSVNKVIPSYYLLLQDNIAERSDHIEVWYDAPGKKLIQDSATKTILGIEIEKEGETIRAEAKNGVILACGGYEANQEMVENYLWTTNTYARTSQHNTGDGIKMAMAVGADLVNMGVVSGYQWDFISPETNRAMNINTELRNQVIFVDGNGTRFMNERQTARRGNTLQSGYWRPPVTPERIFCIFDDAARAAGNLFIGFSADNMAEVEKGWILQADTLEELGAKMGINGEKLAATVSQYNAMAQAGEDYVFGRAADRMSPIHNGPYYAAECHAAITNTQGGPRRNDEAQVIDVFGEVISGLYVVGDMGAPFIGNDWNCGGNLCESIIYGRIAGRNAANKPK